MAFNYDDSKLICIYRWTTCSHEEAVDAWGSRMDPMLAQYQLEFEEHRRVYRQAYYACQICGHPKDHSSLMPPDMTPSCHNVEVNVTSPQLQTAQVGPGTSAPNHVHTEQHNQVGHHQGHETTPRDVIPVVSLPAVTGAQQPFNPPTGPRAARDGQSTTAKAHHPGKPCPDAHLMCHEHYGTDRCHHPWQNCVFARKAIRSAFYAKNAWKGAPRGWNEEHKHCVEGDNLCTFHQRLVDEVGPSITQ